MQDFVQTVSIPSLHKIPKNHKQKIVNIHKDIFELYQFFLCQTVLKSSFDILTKLLNT